MTQQVGLITYLKLKVKTFFEQRVSPSASKNHSRGNTSYTPNLDQFLKERRNTYKTKNTVHVQSGGKTTINGVVYDGDVYIKNGKRLKPGTPEYIAFKKEMEDWQKNFGKQMSDFGVSMEEFSKDMRNMFK